MSTPPASQDIEKLAVIPRFLYSDCDFGGVELPPYIDLRAFSTSLSGGEKPAKPLLQRLTTPFGRAAGVAMMTGSLIVTPLGAMANDAPQVTPPQVTLTGLSAGGQDACVHVEGYSDKSCASEGFATPMTVEEIKGDRALSLNRVILHFGDGIIDADLVAQNLNESGTPALAIPGGPENGIRLILSGMEIKSRTFTQANLDRGEVEAPAPILLKRVQQRQAEHIAATQTAAYVPNN